MKTILFPTDYSKASYNAFEYALALANEEGAKLYVLHVYDPPIISGGISPAQVMSLQEIRDKQNRELVAEQTPILKKIQEESGKTNVEVLFKVVSGYLIPAIKAAVKEFDIDQIVMGTEGDNRSNKKFLGKNTLNTIENLKVPVLSVPKEARFKGIKNMVFLTNLVKEEEPTLDAIAKQAKQSGFKVNCVHVSTAHEYNQDLKNKWKNKYKDIDMSFNIFSSKHSDLKALITYLKVKDIDIVGITHRPRYFFEKLFSHSMTVDLAHQLGVPFLVFRKA